MSRDTSWFNLYASRPSGSKFHVEREGDRFVAWWYSADGVTREAGSEVWGDTFEEAKDRIVATVFRLEFDEELTRLMQ